MKKILLQLDNDKFASVFDAVTAYDAGVDSLLQYGGVQPEDVRNLIYGEMFTRGGEDLKNSAAFIGGSNVEAGEAMLKAAKESFFGPVRVSLMMDANGCNTTATAAVAKMLAHGDLSGKKVAILAGTGPVGLRAAALLAKEGADVVLTSRSLEKAQKACASIEERFNVKVTALGAAGPDEYNAVIKGATAVLTCGAAGVQCVSEKMWKENDSLKVLADVNAVPPTGIEGVKSHWNGKEVDGKFLYGALGIGGFKMKLHRACVAKLFEQNDLVLDAEEIFGIAKTL
jgi:hypothetical protein